MLLGLGCGDCILSLAGHVDRFMAKSVKHFVVGPGSFYETLYGVKKRNRLPSLGCRKKPAVNVLDEA